MYRLKSMQLVERFSNFLVNYFGRSCPIYINFSIVHYGRGVMESVARASSKLWFDVHLRVGVYAIRGEFLTDCSHLVPTSVAQRYNC